MILKYSDQNNYEFFTLDNITFSYSPITEHDGELSYFAMDRDVRKCIRGKLTSDFQLETVDTIVAPTDEHWTISSQALDGSQYNAYIYYIGDKYHMGISKYDLASGNLA